MTKEPIIKLNGWKTIRDFAKDKGCTTQNISQRIKAGKYEIRVIPELNDLKLVRDKD